MEKSIGKKIQTGFLVGSALLTLGGAAAVKGIANVFEYPNKLNIAELQQYPNARQHQTLLEQAQIKERTAQEVPYKHVVRAAASMKVNRPEAMVRPEAAKGYGDYRLSDEENRKLTEYVVALDKTASFEQKNAVKLDSWQAARNEINAQYGVRDIFLLPVLGLAAAIIGVSMISTYKTRKEQR